MKKAFQTMQYRLPLLFVAFMSSVYAFAQEEGGGGSVSSSKSSTTSSTSSAIDSGWYTNPWVWVIGGAVFILILIALLRGKNTGVEDRSGTSSVHKTTVTRTDVSGTDV